MKHFHKIIPLLGLLLLVFAVQPVKAQAPFDRAYLMPLVAGDTITNTGTTTKIFTATSGYGAVSIQPVVTRLTGTGTVTVVLWGSLDGTNYKSLGTIVTTSASPTNTASDIYTVATTPYVYFKAIGTGAGTTSQVLRIYYLLRKYLTQ